MEDKIEITNFEIDVSSKDFMVALQHFVDYGKFWNAKYFHKNNKPDDNLFI